MFCKHNKLCVIKSIGLMGAVLAGLSVNINNVYADERFNSTIDFSEKSEYFTKATPLGENEAGEVEEVKIDIRETPSKEAKVIATAVTGDSIDIIRKDDFWLEVKVKDKTGWVEASDVVSGIDMEAYILKNGTAFDRTGLVIDPDTQLLSPESTEQVVAVLKENQKVTIIRESEDYLYVKAAGKYGNILKDKVKANEIKFGAPQEVKEIPPMIPYVPKNIDPNTTNGYTPLGETEQRKAICNYAIQWIGRPYVYGGTSLETGIDCSAFVQNVYRQIGIGLPRVSSDQANVGVDVDINDIKPGDLLFYYDSNLGRIGHVTMYMGNNTVIHASNARLGVIVSGAGYRPPVKVKRILND